MGTSTESIAVPFKIYLDGVENIPHYSLDDAPISKNDWFLVDKKHSGNHLGVFTIHRGYHSVYVDPIQPSPQAIFSAVTGQLDESQTVFLINESEDECGGGEEWAVFAFNREILEKFVTDMGLNAEICENETAQQTL